MGSLSQKKPAMKAGFWVKNSLLSAELELGTNPLFIDATLALSSQ